MTAQHWEQVFATKDTHQVSWYQDTPTTSLALVADTPGALVDVGAGDSNLVDELLAAGRLDVTVLDISEAALTTTRRRLGDQADRVTFKVADISSWQPSRTYQVWHDRAVFHFLTDTGQRSAYVDLATRTVSVGGALVLGTFAKDGPTHCSGLSTARYTASGLADLFSSGFTLEHHRHEVHRTPAGVEQPFTWVKLRRAEMAGSRSTAD
jgi:hypothetical protein